MMLPARAMFRKLRFQMIDDKNRREEEYPPKYE